MKQLFVNRWAEFRKSRRDSVVSWVNSRDGLLLLKPEEGVVTGTPKGSCVEKAT
jgi:hypothetical protein